MQYIIPDKLDDSLPDLLKLVDKIDTMRQKFPHKIDNFPDARRMALNNCYSFLTSSIFIMNLISKVYNRTINHLEFARMIGLTQGNLNTVLDNLEIHTRHSCLLHFQFQIENLFRNLLKALAKDSKYGFYNISSKLLESITIEERIQKRDELQIPALIRNSLHSNGTHFGPNKNFFLEGISFVFENGRIINCASWSHIYLSFKNVINIIEQILFSHEIAGIKTAIKDNFAWENAGVKCEFLDANSE